MKNDKPVEDLKALTSLRFIAALMIVYFHSSQFGWNWLSFGKAAMVHGVSFFFVLSGFILTHVYTSKPTLGYAAFLRARVARLWPVHLFAIVLLVSVVAPDSITFDGVGIFNKWVVLGFNVALLHSLFPFLAYTFSWNSVSWSISTELFFYLAFPFLVANIGRTWHWKLAGSAALAAAVIVLLWSIRAPLSPAIEELSAVFATYPSPLVRGFEFVLGMTAWVLWANYLRKARLSTVWWSVLELAALALCVWWVGFAFMSYILPAFDPWAGLIVGPAGSCWVFGLLIAVFAGGRGVLSRALGWRPFVFLGEISFSIYMLHLILMKAFVTTLARPQVSAWIYLAVLLPLATASYLFIEKPGQAYLLGRRRAKPAAVAG